MVYLVSRVIKFHKIQVSEVVKMSIDLVHGKACKRHGKYKSRGRISEVKHLRVNGSLLLEETKKPRMNMVKLK